ncbi:MAG: AAA domain-containing protein [Actinomycetota bacterium]
MDPDTPTTSPLPLEPAAGSADDAAPGDGGGAPSPVLTARAHHLLDYLEGLHHLRHPRALDAIPADTILAPAIPSHPAIRVQPDHETLVEIDRVDPPTAPSVPIEVADRISWPDLLRRPRLLGRDAIDGPDDEFDEPDESAADGPDAADRSEERTADHTTGRDPDETVDAAEVAFETWMSTTWEPWFEHARPGLEARRLFLTLYDQRLAAERDLATHEAVWVRGIATGHSAEGERTRLPLFVRPVRYELDDQTGSLRVVATGPARLEIDPFELLVDTFDLIKRIESDLLAGPEEATDATTPSAEGGVANGTVDLPAADTATADRPAADTATDAEHDTAGPGPGPGTGTGATPPPTAVLPTDVTQPLFDADLAPAAFGHDLEPEIDPAQVARDVLERLSKVIADAEFVPLADEIGAVDDHWRIVDVEGLFHRRRPVRYEAYFKALDAALDNGYLPDTWAAILADEPTAAPLSEHIGTNRQPWSSLDDRILSPLPLNAQQRSVLTRLSTNAGVTVQGPPGTGKSYAIAALTSHLLTHGLRVLICAEKPHPLQVIRQQMPEELRELCVAVLGDDRSANQQLEASIGAITTRVNAVDPDRDQAHLDDLDDHLDRIRRRLADLRSHELTIRQSEQQTLHLDDTELGVAEAARTVADTAEADGWLPDDVAPDTPLPLDRAALAEVLDLTGRLDDDDRRRHGLPLVPAEQLITGAQLVQQWQALDRTTDTLDAVAPQIDLDAVAAAGVDHVQAVIDRVAAHRRFVHWAATDWAPVHHAIASSDAQRERWQRLTGQLVAEADGATAVALRLAAHQVTYPSEIEGRDTGPLVAELKARFATGKGLPRLGGAELKALVAATSVDGHAPATVADLEVVERARQCDDHRRRLHNLWRNEVVPHGLPELDEARPEEGFQTSYQQALQTLVDLPAATEAVETAATALLTPAGASDVVFDRAESLDVVTDRLTAATSLFLRQEVTDWLTTFTTAVATLSADGHPTVGALHTALAERDSAAWDVAATETRRLHELAPSLDRHHELTGALATAAPRLAESLRHDDPDHTPEQVIAAWRWRQLRHWVDEILGLGDLATVSARIAEAEREEQRLLTEVVANRAWLQLARRTTGAQRSALEMWAQAMARVGKGTGKHAPRHRATAQRAMRSAQDAVPVWIMSIATAIDSFRPGDDTAFDVVIVDEASQAPLDALAVLGLGQRVLVVGDDKQISPTVFLDETEADRLRRQHLLDVPDADGFDIRTSLYDTAARRFPGVIQLQEHFRCLPEIIDFSNRLSYEGRIDPLREHHPDPEWVPVAAVAVPEGRRDGMVNPAEVDAVLEVVAGLLDDPDLAPGDDYPHGATIGVVCMLGQDQAKAIQGRLIESVSVEEIETRRIRVGSPYEFQGDERDVIVISMVDAPVDDESSVTGQAARSKAHHQRYNVASSRARDRLIVVHSFEPSGLDEGDLRRNLVSFAQNPSPPPAPAPDLRGRCQTRFERDVLERLDVLAVDGDLLLDAQYPVAGYRLDFTVTDRNRLRVAVECDGDSLRTVNQLTHDAARQRVLERLGWRFVRIRASEFYSDPDRAMAGFTDRLVDHGLDLTPAPTPTPDGVDDGGGDAVDD